MRAAAFFPSSLFWRPDCSSSPSWATERVFCSSGSGSGSGGGEQEGGEQHLPTVRFCGALKVDVIRARDLGCRDATLAATAASGSYGWEEEKDEAVAAIEEEPKEGQDVESILKGLEFNNPLTTKKSVDLETDDEE